MTDLLVIVHQIDHLVLADGVLRETELLRIDLIVGRRSSSLLSLLGRVVIAVLRLERGVFQQRLRRVAARLLVPLQPCHFPLRVI